MRQVARAAVAAVILDRLQGKHVAVVLDHQFSRAFTDEIRGWLAQSGAAITSFTTVTKSFVTMAEADPGRPVQSAVVLPALRHPVSARPRPRRWPTV